ncbi:MAG TPA: aminodeoxychorismate synthase component I [Gemmataceae bacterium]|nr:aminodeoxychorismate synthase component I [Gemmataceae bacterium]
MNRQDFLPCVEELRPAPKPEDCWLRLAGLPHVLFLDSALRHPTLGRYSFLTADPFDWLQARGPSTAVSSERQVREPANPFTVLAECLDRYRTEPLPGLPPFQGGVAGLWGYDLCHHLERLPRPLRDEFQVPDLAVGFYDWVLAFDHAADRTWLISTGFPELDPSRRERRARRRIREILERLRAAPPAIRHKTAERPIDLADQWPIAGCPGLRSTFSRESYVAAVGRVLAYIHAGDCFQVNLAQRLLYPADEPSVELYVRLRACNPAPFAGYFDLGEFTLASASPERFLRVEQGEVETRPIKGTRPRGATPAEDQERIEELQQSAKDRAENIMIVDLLRNDLGRVCRYGSVRVPAVCRVESYPFVHHLVSEVRGRLWPGLGPVDLLRAAFPGGSVTGAPKIRAMEIIAELEPTVRGPYCGSLGYIGFDGAMDSNILIRTLTVGRGWIQFPVGGGIVADSVPLREYDETWHKAEGLLRAFR